MWETFFGLYTFMQILSKEIENTIIYNYFRGKVRKFYFTKTNFAHKTSRAERGMFFRQNWSRELMVK